MGGPQIQLWSIYLFFYCLQNIMKAISWEFRWKLLSKQAKLLSSCYQSYQVVIKVVIS